MLKVCSISKYSTGEQNVVCGGDLCAFIRRTVCVYIKMYGGHWDVFALKTIMSQISRVRYGVVARG